MATGVTSHRSTQFHVKASPIQPHAWYHEMYAGTLCGRYIRVERIETRDTLAELLASDETWCPDCARRGTRLIT